jgi:DivIVA domain-containing protein
VSPEASPSKANDELIRLVERVQLKSVRLREGYDMGEVDRLLRTIVEALRRGESVRRMVDDARITPVRLRRGYDMLAVDEFLDTITERADPNQ